MTNPGSVPVADGRGHRRQRHPADPGDDFNPAYVGGDTDLDGLLDLAETLALPGHRDGRPGRLLQPRHGHRRAAPSRPPTRPATPASRSPPSRVIAIVKLVNGADANSPAGPSRDRRRDGHLDVHW